MNAKELKIYADSLEADRQKMIEKLKTAKLVEAVQDSSVDVETSFLVILRYNLTRFQPRAGKRSNWTYKVANAMMMTCETMHLEISFEEMGRHDAVIRDPLTDEIAFFAEWEWDYPSIMGQQGELEKLFRSVNKESRACALLFTYCHREKCETFVTEVAKRWAELIQKDGPDAPPLFLIIGLIDKDPTDQQEFIPCLRTVTVFKEEIHIYDDFYL